jgi:hypothetical protein
MEKQGEILTEAANYQFVTFRLAEKIMTKTNSIIKYAEQAWDGNETLSIHYLDPSFRFTKCSCHCFLKQSR